MKSMSKVLLVVALASTGLTGCMSSISPNTYETSSAGQVNHVISGVIVSARPVKVSGDTATQGGGMVGTGVGAVGGAIAGSAIGGGRGQALATLGGAVLGGVLGNYAEKGITSQQGIEYIVKTNKGSLITVTQGADSPLAVGQHVFVEYGDRARIVVDPSNGAAN